MKTRNRFRVGDIVKVLVGHNILSIKNGVSQTIDMHPEKVGKLAIIIECGSSNSYGIMMLEDGRESWWSSASQLEFHDDGIDYLMNLIRNQKIVV